MVKEMTPERVKTTLVFFKSCIRRYRGRTTYVFCFRDSFDHFINDKIISSNTMLWHCQSCPCSSPFKMFSVD